MGNPVNYVKIGLWCNLARSSGFRLFEAFAILDSRVRSPCGDLLPEVFLCFPAQRHFLTFPSSQIEGTWTGVIQYMLLKTAVIKQLVLTGVSSTSDIQARRARGLVYKDKRYVS